MSFFVYDLTFLIIFCIFLVIFLFKRRKKLKREGILYLYKTDIGLKIIDYLGKRYRKILRGLSYAVVGLGYVLMVLMIYFLFKLIYIFSNPQFVKIIKIPPLMPLIPYLPSLFKISWLPTFYFTYWILAIAVVAIVHEGFHGIYARLHNIRIKSTGFGFLGPFLAFFVEQDEKDMNKAKIFSQLSVLASGVFANIIAMIFFFLIMWLFFISVFYPAGVIFVDYTQNIAKASDIIITDEKLFVESAKLNLTKVLVDGRSFYANNEDIGKSEEDIYVYEDSPALRNGLAGVIIEFNGKEIKTNEDLRLELLNKKPGDKVDIKTLVGEEIKEYELELGEKPNDEEKAYLGIALRNNEISLFGKIRSRFLFFRDPNIYYEARFAGNFATFIYYLLWWLVLINFSVALVNMLPVGIFDGGRFFYLTILAVSGSKKIAKRAYQFSTYFLLLILLLAMYLWFVGIR